jgi:hypothetical protein
MQSTFRNEKMKKQVKQLLVFFMVMLLLSGLTAIPLEWGLSIANRFLSDTMAGPWLDQVYTAIRNTGDSYPFLFYGYDWLAFAHIVLAILFIGPIKDPVRNKWVVEFGIYACLLIVPFALVAGHFRGIPFWWRLIDCSFGIIGLFPLIASMRRIITMEQEEENHKPKQEYEFNY